jgi:hypothetical protein
MRCAVEVPTADGGAVDIQEEIQMIRLRLTEEGMIASRFGAGPWAYFRGALYELSRKGMWNRVLLVFVSFTLQNMSGAAGACSLLLNKKTSL